MMKCLQKYNMGSKFIKWIKILHNQTQSCVSNNGYLSEYFYLGRGITQGGPISALLFISVAEALAVKIRKKNQWNYDQQRRVQNLSISR